MLFVRVLLTFGAVLARGLALTPTSIELFAEVWSNSTQYSSSPCNVLPVLTTLPPSVSTLVQLNDTWQTIVDRNNVSSVRKLLALNNILLEDIQTTDGFTDQPVPGTYLVIAAPPSIAPQCQCPKAYPILSDDESLCYDTLLQASLSRLASAATLPAYLTGTVLSGYWEPNRTALVSDAVISLTVLRELTEVDLYFTRLSGLPLRVDIFASTADAGSYPLGLVQQSPLSAQYDSIMNANSQPESSWTKILTMVSTTSGLPCVAPACQPLQHGLAPGPLDPAVPVTATFLRLRFFRDTRVTASIQVECVCCVGH